MLYSNPKILEVIVNTLEDAIEAQAGGADRLEVVRNLELGGLTPGLDLVEDILAAVKIPVRVMLRENPSMLLAGSDELAVLCRKAQLLDQMKVDGLVAGFIADDQLDMPAMHAINAAAPRTRVTFHRAFDALSDPIRAIHALKTIPLVDRILTVGGAGDWMARKQRLHQWQLCAAPNIIILTGVGLLETAINDLRTDEHLTEIHVGRAARLPPTTDGKVNRVQVAQLKGMPA